MNFFHWFYLFSIAVQVLNLGGQHKKRRMDMYEVETEICQQLEGLKEKGVIRTGDVRKVAATEYKKLKNRSTEDVFELCEHLLDKGDWALKVIAFEFAHRRKAHYGPGTFDRFESWLFKYVRDWGDCDDFCTHAFGDLLAMNPQLAKRVSRWTGCNQFWVRRASAVILIPSIRKDVQLGDIPFEIASDLLHDSHHLVLKGYGWMLKELGRKHPDPVIDFLRRNVSKMPRVSFRYALEKLDSSQKDSLMKLDG